MVEAQQYFGAWAKIKWADNFKIWCNWSEGESIEQASSWQKFVQQDYIQEQFARYVIYKLKFPASSLASLLRMQDMCLPLDLPFITNVEKLYYKQMTESLDSLVLQKIQTQVSFIDAKDAVREVTVSAQ